MFNNGPQICNISRISRLLQKWNLHKVSGLNYILDRLLKETACGISHALLTIIYQETMETILTDWKSAIAAPVFNKGDRSRNQASNYRPISLASICCKINEHITNNSTLAHLKQITFSMNNSMSSVSVGPVKRSLSWPSMTWINA